MMTLPASCSHDWRDEETIGRLVLNFRVAPYVQAGNPKAMQPGHRYRCQKCSARLRISDEGRPVAGG